MTALDLLKEAAIGVILLLIVAFSLAVSQPVPEVPTVVPVANTRCFPEGTIGVFLFEGCSDGWKYEMKDI